jgi:hypothetical protein
MRLLRFLLFLLFTSNYLHQAHTYMRDDKDALYIELVHNDNLYVGDTTSFVFRWITTIWNASGSPQYYD